MTAGDVCLAILASFGVPALVLIIVLVSTSRRAYARRARRRAEDGRDRRRPGYIYGRR